MLDVVVVVKVERLHKSLKNRSHSYMNTLVLFKEFMKISPTLQM